MCNANCTDINNHNREKHFKVQVAAIASIPIFSSFSSAWGQQQSVAVGNLRSRKCKSIARIISGDLRLANFSELCEQDQLQPDRDKGTVEVLCYLSGEILRLSGGIISNQCLPPSDQPVQRCSSEIRSNCLKVKGPDEDNNAPTRITPYSALILNPRPVMLWTPVHSAISYIVQIKGTGVDWSIEVNSNSLPYPKEQPAMQPGSIYQVNVLAKIGEQKFVPSSSILMVIPSEKEQHIKAVMKYIQNLNLSPDDLAVDSAHIYRANDLLTEAIEVLNKRIKAKTQNPTIYRTLGDLYLEVGLPQMANREYNTAIQYARLKRNLNELAKAEEGLRLTRDKT
ncbi:tetratricopeptide repeat protein [Nostoc sp. CCY0012]|uniref:tetratricopeptide repeat protein n=1 Tax=Nostoc sp. CCY0012 TaxID=1056123 RepID=UPI0039C61802